MSDIAPITLHTDASDCGIGGYLFQTVDGIDQPVAFVSRSLNKSQLRWSMIQKEVDGIDQPVAFVSKSLNESQLRWSVIQKVAYGIFYSCMYSQSLLCDQFFTIRTDHRNLLFITEASNPMIARWYMALFEFSFTLEFIPGVDNDIADSLSRLCRNNMIDPRNDIHQNISYQHYISSHTNLVLLNIQRLARCTTQ